MKYMGTLIAVGDMQRAKRFYHDVLGLQVKNDFGANVELTAGVFLQMADTWKDFIRKDASEIVFGGNAAELYFETDDTLG